MAVCHNEQSASLLWFHRKQAAPRPNSNLSAGFGSRFALFFESRTQSRTAVQAECRGHVCLHYAEAQPAFAAEQQQYAPSFSLSAPCILLTLTHRLRFRSCLKFFTILKRLDFQEPGSGFCLPIGGYFGSGLRFSRQIAWLSSFEKRGAIPRNPLPMA